MNLRMIRNVVLSAALAATPVAARPEAGERIEDNSFLIEEAYNQEPGVIQHIGTFARGRDGGWVASFTEEWPVGGETHQLSFTLQAARLAEIGHGLGDLALNYRYQAVDAHGVAVAPRVSLIVPTGDSARGLGSGTTGVQALVPVSLELHRLVTAHLNAGGTWLPNAREPGGDRGTLTALTAGGSVIGLLHPKFNVLVEALYTTTAHALPGGTVRAEALVVNPGARAAIDVGTLQIVPGLSFPIGVGPSAGERAVFLYLSFEHPCSWAGPTEPPKKS